MLVITKIAEIDKVVDHYICNLPHEHYRRSDKENSYLFYVFKTYEDSGVKFDVYDSNKDHMFKGLNFPELYKICNKNVKSVLGILEFRDRILFLSVDLITWKLLSCINKVNQFGVSENPIQFVKHLNKGFYLASNDYLASGTYITKLENSNKDCIYLCDFPFTIDSFDENGIFYHVRDTIYFNLYHMYSIMYDLDITNCKLIYLIGRNYKMIELEVNNEVIKIMTKAKVLGDKLCWS